MLEVNDSVLMNEVDDTTQSQEGNTPKPQEETPPQEDNSWKEEDYKEKLVKTYDSDKNKAFALLRMKEKLLAESELKIRTLEEKLNKAKYSDSEDERSKFDKWFNEKQEAEKELQVQKQTFVSQKEKELVEKWLTRPEVNKVFKFAIDFTDWDVDKAYKLYNEFHPHKVKTKPEMNFNARANTPDVWKNSLWNNSWANLRSELSGTDNFI